MSTSADGGLSALRAAIVSDRPISLSGTTLTIDGVEHDGLAETAFETRAGHKRNYKLLALWLQYEARAGSFTDYMTLLKQASVNIAFAVIVTDKAAVVDYLAGKSTAAVHVSGAVSARSDGTAAGAAAFNFDEPPSLAMAMRREVHLRTRASVLDAPSRVNLRDFVFAKIEEANASARGAPPAAAAAAAVGGKRPRGGAVSAAAAAASLAASLESFRGTPVILVPATVTSLISLRNVAALLEQGRFVPPAEARAAALAAAGGGGADAEEVRLPRVVDVRRRDAASGAERVYHVIDDASLLRSRADWLRVVAVFAQGPDWQFRGWRWGREDARRPDITPAEIFDRCAGFHLMFGDDAPHPNIPKWNVKILRISKTARHADSTAALEFWAAVEADMANRKSYLTRPKAAAEA